MHIIPWFVEKLSDMKPGQWIERKFGDCCFRASADVFPRKQLWVFFTHRTMFEEMNIDHKTL